MNSALKRPNWDWENWNFLNFPLLPNQPKMQKQTISLNPHNFFKSSYPPFEILGTKAETRTALWAQTF